MLNLLKCWLIEVLQLIKTLIKMYTKIRNQGCSEYKTNEAWTHAQVESTYKCLLPKKLHHRLKNLKSWVIDMMAMIL